MYGCFKGIPKKKRQESFDFLKKKGYGKYHTEGEFMSYVFIPTFPFVYGGITYTEVECCPLGAIVLKSGIKDNWQSPEPKGRLYNMVELLTPLNGRRAVLFLGCGAGYNVNENDAQRFIDDNDQGKFDTLEKLARAMGVQYKGQASHE